MKKFLILITMLLFMLVLSSCNGNTNIAQNNANRPVIKFFSSSVIDRTTSSTESDKSNVKFYEHLEEKLNVKIETEVPPSANYNERLQIMLAGGDYPDVIAFPDHNDKAFLSAVNSGMIVPLNDYLKDAPNIMKYTSDITWKALKIKQDDNIYAIPRSSIMRADGYMVRQDWLDNLGITLPESGIITLDQLTDILTKFTYKDPDGNGKKDTYGMVSFQTVSGAFDPPFLWPFGVVGWQKHEGEYEYMDETYCLEHSNYKDALSYANMLYTKGLLDPDSLVIKQDSAMERFNKGIVGLMTNFSGNTMRNYEIISKHTPEVEIGYITAVKGPKGYVKGNLIGAGYYWCWALSESSQHKEKAVAILDYILSDEIWDTVKYGFENVNFTVEDGIRKPIYDSFGQQIIMATGKTFVRRHDDRDLFVNLGMPDNSKPDITLRSNWLGQCIDNFQPSLDLGFRPEAASKIVDAQKMLTQVVSKIIVGELPVEEYDKEMKKWYEAGGRDYVSEMNEYIKKTQ